MSETISSGTESCQKLTPAQRLKQGFDNACQRIKADTKKAISTLVPGEDTPKAIRALVLGAAVAVGPSVANASTPEPSPVAVASAPKLNFDAPDVKQALGTFDETMRKDVIQTLGHAEELRQRGEISPDMILKIETQVLGLDRAKDLSFIQNNLALAPKKTFLEVVGEGFKGIDILNDEEGYKALIEKLYDPSEVSKWYRIGEERREPTPEELTRRIDTLKRGKELWLLAPTNWKNQINAKTLDKNVYQDANTLFNESVKKLPEFTTETVRTLLVSTLSMAFNKNLTQTEEAQNIRTRQRINMATNVSWVAALTSNTDTPMLAVKITYGPQKITFVGGEELKKSPMLKSYSYVGPEALMTLKEVTADAQTIQRNKTEVGVIQANIAMLDKEIGTMRQDITLMRQEIEQLELSLQKQIQEKEQMTRIKQIGKELIGLSRESRALSNSLVDDINDVLSKGRTDAIILRAQAKIEKLKQNSLRIKEIEQEASSDMAIKNLAHSILAMIQTTQKNIV